MFMLVMSTEGQMVDDGACLGALLLLGAAL